MNRPDAVVRAVLRGLAAYHRRNPARGRRRHGGHIPTPPRVMRWLHHDDHLHAMF